jgi:hypothetical protein
MNLSSLALTLQLFHPAGEPERPSAPLADPRDEAAPQHLVAEMLGLYALSYRRI